MRKLAEPEKAQKEKFVAMAKKLEISDSEADFDTALERIGKVKRTTKSVKSGKG